MGLQKVGTMKAGHGTLTGPATRAALIGVGNEFRRDDGVGPRLVTGLRDRVPADVRTVLSDGDPAELIGAWAGARLAVVVDAVRAEPAVPGRLHRLVLDHRHPIPGRAVSSHGLGVGDAIGLARALGRLPGRLIVHAVEAGDVTPGTGLTAAVSAALPQLAAAVLTDLS
jgi:hydrogenase maturation protease